MFRARLVLAMVVIGALVAVVAVVASPSQATYRGKNGRIAFRRYFDQDHNVSGIFTINPDGSGETRIPHPSKGMVDDQPDWSPDGKLIAFTRCLVNGACGVYLMKADGTGLKRLSAPPCKAGPPKCEDD